MSERDDGVIVEAARELRRPVRIDPELDARVMAEVEALARGGLATSTRLAPAGTAVRRAPGARRLAAAWDWLRRPRSVSVSPLGALGVAAAGVALVVAGFGIRHSGFGAAPRAELASREASTNPQSRIPGPESRIPTAAPVQFVLVAPGASTVAVVGDFNDWDSTATRLRPAAAGGVWAVTVPLAPGRHRYAFIVDGRQWRPDPNAPRARDDDFGVPSSVVTVAERRS